MSFKVFDKEYLASYQRLLAGQLTLVSLIRKDVAYEAAAQLVRRSIFAGASILLITLGFTLVFARRLTIRLRELWRATTRVAEGDFSVRVDTGSLVSDEVSGLGISFNKMAGKIDELIAETARAARMEKELETARTVQRLFFPERRFVSSRFMVGGKSIPASECSGDWWNYAEIGKHVLLVIGDVTGHGVSAALVTSAAHHAFSNTVREIKRGGEAGAGSLRLLFQNMNSAVFDTAKGNARMTFLAFLVDAASGDARMINASHPIPYLIRGGAVREVLRGAQCAGLGEALGDASFGDIEPGVFKLAPGDVLLAFTDGIFEPRKSDGKRLNHLRLVESFGSALALSPKEPEKACDRALGEVLSFLDTGGSGEKERPDDLSVVAGVFV